MKVKVKLLERNLIRSYGAVNIEMDEGKARRLIDAGKAISDHDFNKEIKVQRFPEEHKAIFQAPEDKIIETFINRYPGVNDSLFPQIKRI